MQLILLRRGQVMEETFSLRENPGHGGGSDAMIADLEEARGNAGLANSLGNGTAGLRRCIEGGAEVDQWYGREERRWGIRWGAGERAGEARTEMRLSGTNFVEDCRGRLDRGRHTGTGFCWIGTRLWRKS